MQANDGLSKKFALLENAHSLCLDKERELLDQLKDMEKERDDWRQTTSEQVKRIRKLEESIKPKSKQLADAEERIKMLKGEKTTLVAKLAQAEMDLHKLVREFFLTVVKRLHISVEYQKSLATSVSLCFIAGWLGCLSQGKNHEESATMLSETSDLDIEGLKTWEDKHRKLFTMQYSYVQKVADSYRLPVDALIEVSPDVPAFAADDETGPSTTDDNDGTTLPTSPRIQMIGTATDTDQDSAHMVAASKVPMLKPSEYEIGRMRIEQYIQMIDYALWEVIENGATLPKTTIVEGVVTFNSIKDAKKLLEAVEKRFGGNAATRKTQRNILKHQLEILDEKLSQEDINQKLLRSLSPEWNTHAVVWRNKADLDTMSMDDLYNNHRL
ncbi:hypothetical protein Tco_0109936 [Tanacetum coccineum]